jgi:hypothetical protein
MNYGLKQHKILVLDQDDEEKFIFKMEFNVLNNKRFKASSKKKVKTIVENIDFFIESLQRFKSEIQQPAKKK